MGVIALSKQDIRDDPLDVLIEGGHSLLLFSGDTHPPTPFPQALIPVIYRFSHNNYT